MTNDSKGGKKMGIKGMKTFFPKFTSGRRKGRNKQIECRGRLTHG
jgi:hypothetical protein